MAKKSSGKSAKKTVTAQPKLVAKTPRKIKVPEPKWWQFGKRLRMKHPVKLPSVWWLTKASAKLIWQNKKLFMIITLVYGLLNLVLVKGLASSTDVSSLKTSLNSVFHGHFNQVGTSLGTFTVLLGSAGNGTSQTAGAYQLFLAIVTSLAAIWLLRQVFLGNKVRVRDAYYSGMYPLIPFILVLLVIGIQLIPLVVGATIYALIVSSGIAVNVFEQLIFLAIFLMLAAWTVYMLCASFFALYIVTLPEMTPLKALRSARRLVRHRRATVLRKIIWLPILLIIIAAVIMVPIIVTVTVLAQWVFFVLTMFALIAIHTYMYTLYRELLNE